MRFPTNRKIRLLVGACVVIAVGAIATVVQASIPDGNVIHGCYDAGGSLKVVPALPCARGYTGIDWNQQGPPGQNGTDGTNGTNGTNGKDGTNGTNGANGVSVTSAPLAPGQDVNCPNGGTKFTAANNNVTYACNGANGTNGTNGMNGTNGTNGSGPTSQSCEAGSYVTGFDASGNITCSCPHTGYTFDITASDFATQQYWPDTQLTVTDPHNSACSVTVQTPSSGNRQLSEPINGAAGDAGWAYVSSTGYPSGTTFTVDVHTPNCTSPGAVGSVVNNYPECSNSSVVFASDESTDEAIVTPN
jgi:hypothetical protein